jgi:hypothetical protein
VDGFLALDLAPGKDVRYPHNPPAPCRERIVLTWKQIRNYIERKAEEEGIEL